jgi:hypothetical protein
MARRSLGRRVRKGGGPLLFALASAAVLPSGEPERRPIQPVGPDPVVLIVDVDQLVAIDRVMSSSREIGSAVQRAMPAPIDPAIVRESAAAELSLAGGVAPAGERGLDAAFDWEDTPDRLRTAIARLDSIERLRVRIETSSSDGVEVEATLTQVGSSYELVSVAADDPNGPRNVVTVVGDTAYIEDVGEHFDLEPARFRIQLDEQFTPGLDVEWWRSIVVADSPAEWDLATIPSPEQTEYIGFVPSGFDPARFVVTTEGWLGAFEQDDRRLVFDEPGEIEIDVPAWASGPDDAVAATWDEVLAADPALVDSLDRVIQVAQVPPDGNGVDAGPLDSQCGSPPYTPAELPDGVPALPDGAIFRCQIDLADLRDTAALPGLPTTGLLQLFLVEFDGVARYVAEPDLDDHDPEAALALVEDDSPEIGWDGRSFGGGPLLFAAAYTSSDDAIYDAAPRPMRYRRRRRPYPDVELRDALAHLGIRYLDNDLNMMGGTWSGNGETPTGFERLLTIGDDIGYSYWHIPVADRATGRFERVIGGWTD